MTHVDIDTTIAWVRELHAGQTDKSGAPYIGHVLRVYQRLCDLFPTASEETRHAALLHDTLEDCDVTPADLRARGYNEDTITLVQWVTKNPDDGLTYLQRIEHLAAAGPIGAMQVKLADLTDNSDPDRLAALPADKARSLAKRYHHALEILHSKLAQNPAHAPE